MGRELRMVAQDWEHPKNDEFASGYEPLLPEQMPQWDEDEKTHFQMHEDTSEGTPKSPPMESKEALAQWCVDNEVSIFAGRLASYDEWMTVIEGKPFYPVIYVDADFIKKLK